MPRTRSRSVSVPPFVLRLLAPGMLGRRAERRLVEFLNAPDLAERLPDPFSNEEHQLVTTVCALLVRERATLTGSPSSINPLRAFPLFVGSCALLEALILRGGSNGGTRYINHDRELATLMNLLGGPGELLEVVKNPGSVDALSLMLWSEQLRFFLTSALHREDLTAELASSVLGQMLGTGSRSALNLEGEGPRLRDALDKAVATLEGTGFVIDQDSVLGRQLATVRRRAWKFRRRAA